MECAVVIFEYLNYFLSTWTLRFRCSYIFYLGFPFLYNTWLSKCLIPGLWSGSASSLKRRHSWGTLVPDSNSAHGNKARVFWYTEAMNAANRSIGNDYHQSELISLISSTNATFYKEVVPACSPWATRVSLSIAGWSISVVAYLILPAIYRIQTIHGLCHCNNITYKMVVHNLFLFGKVVPCCTKIGNRHLNLQFSFFKTSMHSVWGKPYIKSTLRSGKNKRQK